MVCWAKLRWSSHAGALLELCLQGRVLTQVRRMEPACCSLEGHVCSSQSRERSIDHIEDLRYLHHMPHATIRSRWLYVLDGSAPK